jgi:hypothetical protein
MRLKYVTLFAAVFIGPVWGQAPPPQPPAPPLPPRPGAVNYVEGQVMTGTQPIGPNSIGTVQLGPNQAITTQAGKAEILLTPGVFVRMDDQSTVTMVSPDLANTEVRLDKGRAMVEVVEIRKENRILVDMAGVNTRLTKTGLYEFDANQKQIRTFKGESEVQENGKTIKIGENHMLVAGGDGKPVKFDEKQYQDDFYRWCSLRSGYMSEASMDAARNYVPAAEGGPYGPGWGGLGWYWDPYFSGWTFLPGDGIYYGPFGFGFWSPLEVYRSPYFYRPFGPHPFNELHYPVGHGFPGGGFRGGGFRGGGGFHGGGGRR